jgi:hypothetical protein
MLKIYQKKNIAVARVELLQQKYVFIYIYIYIYIHTGKNCLRYGEQLIKRDLQQLYSSSTVITLTTSRTLRFNPNAHMTEMKAFKIQALGDVTPCRLVNTD